METKLANTQTENLQTRDHTKRDTDPLWKRPPVDIYEHESSYLLLADCPGTEPDSFEVEYVNGQLSLKAWPAPQGNDAAATGYYFNVQLGNGIDPNAINAQLKHGVLRIELGKSEGLKPRRIEVRAA
jgi:HSP20 family protein